MSDTLHIDQAVVRRIRNGDEAAFRRIFDDFYPRLYRYALARLNGDREAAGDVVQQTFCKAVEQLDSYRGEAALFTWFSQICRNTLVDHWRATNRQGRMVVLLEDQPNVRAILDTLAAPATDRPDVGAWQLQVRRLVEATLDTLPAHYGDVLEWKYVDGLSLKEIAGRLQVGPKAAESLLGRARSAFREAIAAVVDAPDALLPPREN